MAYKIPMTEGVEDSEFILPELNIEIVPHTITRRYDGNGDYPIKVDALRINYSNCFLGFTKHNPELWLFRYDRRNTADKNSALHSYKGFVHPAHNTKKYDGQNFFGGGSKSKTDWMGGDYYLYDSEWKFVNNTQKVIPYGWPENYPPNQYDLHLPFYRTDCLIPNKDYTVPEWYKKFIKEIATSPFCKDFFTHPEIPYLHIDVRHFKKGYYVKDQFIPKEDIVQYISGLTGRYHPFREIVDGVVETASYIRYPDGTKYKWLHQNLDIPPLFDYGLDTNGEDIAAYDDIRYLNTGNISRQTTGQTKEVYKFAVVIDNPFKNARSKKIIGPLSSQSVIFETSRSEAKNITQAFEEELKIEFMFDASLTDIKMDIPPPLNPSILNGILPPEMIASLQGIANPPNPALIVAYNQFKEKYNEYKNNRGSEPEYIVIKKKMQALNYYKLSIDNNNPISQFG